MDLLQLAGIVAAIGTVGGGITWAIRQGWRVMRAVHQLIELIQGRPARFDGDPDARPGLAQHLVQLDEHLAAHAERLERGDARFDALDAAVARVGAELHPNGGGSLRDQVDGLRDQVVEVARATGAAGQ